MMLKRVMWVISLDTEQEKWGEASLKNTVSTTTKPSAKWLDPNHGEYSLP